MESSIDQKPLVTILIVTYNSSKYVLETLESAKLQTYQNIELIVTDDCSTDQTVDLCGQWINVNRQRFTRVELITVLKNTGIPANLNRGYKASNSRWIKAIAGDDALLPSCIEDYMNFVIANPDARIIHSIARVYKDSFCAENFIQLIDTSNRLNFSDNLTASDQYELLLRNSLVAAPTVFINYSLIDLIGYNDESIPYIEDWPNWLKITKAGEKIYFLNAATVLYRMHNESVQNKKDSNLLYNDYIIKQRPVYLKYIKDNIPITERIVNDLHFYFGVLVLKYFNQNRTFNRIVFGGIMRAINKIREIYVNHFTSSRIRKRVLGLSANL